MSQPAESRYLTYFHRTRQTLDQMPHQPNLRSDSSEIVTVTPRHEFYLVIQNISDRTVEVHLAPDIFYPVMYLDPNVCIQPVIVLETRPAETLGLALNLSHELAPAPNDYREPIRLAAGATIRKKYLINVLGNRNRRIHRHQMRYTLKLDRFKDINSDILDKISICDSYVDTDPTPPTPEPVNPGYEHLIAVSSMLGLIVAGLILGYLTETKQK